MGILNKIINKIFGIDIRKSNPSYQWSTESQSGKSIHDGNNAGLEARMRDLEPFRPGIEYQVMERDEMPQTDYGDVVDRAGTRKAKKDD